MTMPGECFQRLIEQAFDPFLIELGFKPDKPYLSGKYHRARFIGDKYTLVVSIESNDSFITAMLIRNDDNNLSSIDDSNKTPRLSDLNRLYMEEIDDSEMANNELYFSSIKITTQEERALLKCAKELRLVLPRFLEKNPSN